MRSYSVESPPQYAPRVFPIYLTGIGMPSKTPSPQEQSRSGSFVLPEEQHDIKVDTSQRYFGERLESRSDQLFDSPTAIEQTLAKQSVELTTSHTPRGSPETFRKPKARRLRRSPSVSSNESDPRRPRKKPRRTKSVDDAYAADVDTTPEGRGLRTSHTSPADSYMGDYDLNATANNGLFASGDYDSVVVRGGASRSRTYDHKLSWAGNKILDQTTIQAPRAFTFKRRATADASPKHKKRGVATKKLRARKSSSEGGNDHLEMFDLNSVDVGSASQNRRYDQKLVRSEALQLRDSLDTQKQRDRQASILAAVRGGGQYEAGVEVEPEGNSDEDTNMESDSSEDPEDFGDEEQSDPEFAVVRQERSKRSNTAPTRTGSSPAGASEQATAGVSSRRRVARASTVTGATTVTGVGTTTTPAPSNRARPSTRPRNPPIARSTYPVNNGYVGKFQHHVPKKRTRYGSPSKSIPQRSPVKTSFSRNDQTRQGPNSGSPLRTGESLTRRDTDSTIGYSSPARRSGTGSRLQSQDSEDGLDYGSPSKRSRTGSTRQSHERGQSLNDSPSKRSGTGSNRHSEERGQSTTPRPRCKKTQKPPVWEGYRR